AASNHNLESACKEGKFREDLYYRLSVIPIKIPPLRDRREDIPALVSNFLNIFEKENRRRINIAPDAVEAMKAYEWPGNVRELENLIKRMATLCEDDFIRTSDLPSQFPKIEGKSSERPIITLDKFIEGQATAYMKEVLLQCGGDYEKASLIIGKKPAEIKRKLASSKKQNKNKVE
ncbi:MAG TPA: sigma 54-interacting transcriptional regulator, partial [Victivallales bacterium]|nr:sigma 54-interacting transcriptional regulator [Victivallales bacterium]